MAEITAEDAKSMSCAKLTKLNLFRLVAADRGEPCGYCRGPIKRGHGDCGRCNQMEKEATPWSKPSRHKHKEQPAPPSPTLQPYPVCRTSLVVPTAEDALSIYGNVYTGGQVRERQGYKTPRLEHRHPLVLQLLDDEGKCVLDERSIVRMTGWEDVANDWERHLGVFGFDPRADEQVYSIRRCDVVDRITVTPYIRENLGKYSVDALVALASRNGLIDELSVLCNCFAMLAGGVVALAHDPEAQENYCGTLTRIVGDLFRTDYVKVTVATELLDLAQPVNWDKIQRSLLEGSLGTLSSFCDETGARLPICEVVSAVPGGDSARAAKIYAAADGTARTGAFMVTGARKVTGRSMCRRPHFLLVFIDVRRSHCLSEQFWVSRRRICTHAAHEDGHLAERRRDVSRRGARVYARFGRHFERREAFR